MNISQPSLRWWLRNLRVRHIWVIIGDLTETLWRELFLLMSRGNWNSTEQAQEPPDDSSSHTETLFLSYPGKGGMYFLWQEMRGLRKPSALCRHRADVGRLGQGSVPLQTPEPSGAW